MYISLKAKIWLLVNLAILSFAVFILLYFPAQQYTYLTETQDKEVQYIANSIATGVTIALSEENFQGINDAMKYARSDSRFRFAAMFYLDSAGPASGGDEKAVLFKIYPEQFKIDENISSDRNTTVKRARFNSEVMNGEIILGFHTDEIHASVNNLRRSILVAGIIALLLCSVLSYFISSTIIRPLRALRDASFQIGAGNLYPEININTNDEVSDLGVAFSQMAGEIEKSRQNIKQKNEELRQTNQDLIKLNHEKNNLITMVSHDLKSPLYQIKGLLALIREENKSAGNRNFELLNKADSSVTRLGEMISKILDIEAIESHKHNVNLQATDLISLLKRTIKHYYVLAEDKKLEIRFDTQNHHMVWTDEDYAIQIFDNLLSNAIKFSPVNSVIYINVVDKKDTIATEFIDSGPGVTKEDQPKLFQKYQKLSAQPTSDETSTGLGLSIVKKYVDMLGGKVYYKDSDRSGGTFVVEFKKPTA